MLRFLLGRRFLGLTALAVLLIAAFVALGAWQWDRAQSRTVDPLTRPAVALDEVSAAGTAAVAGSGVARAVVARGTYEPGTTYRVVDPEGGPVRVMTPLRLADGSLIPVVHGTVASVGATVTVPPGPVEVRGRLQASEPAPSRATADDDPQALRLASITTSELAGVLDGPVRPGFVVASQESPQVRGVQAVPVDDLAVPPRGLRLQNLAYTVLWFFFAGFVAFVYVRLVREDWADVRAARDPREVADGHAGEDREEAALRSGPKEERSS